MGTITIDDVDYDDISGNLSAEDITAIEDGDFVLIEANPPEMRFYLECNDWYFIFRSPDKNGFMVVPIDDYNNWDEDWEVGV